MAANLKIRVFANGDQNTPATIVMAPSRGMSMPILLDRVRSNYQLTNGGYYVAAPQQAFKPVSYKVPAGVSTASSHARVSSNKGSSPAKSKSRGKVILVSKNGDSHAPTRIPIPTSGHRINDIIELINQRLVLSPTDRVARICTAEGKPVSTPSQLQHQALYVVCGARERFQPLPYDLWKAATVTGQKTIEPNNTQKSNTRNIVAKVNTTKFDAVEMKMKNILKDSKALSAAWRSLDFNGNGLVSLAEIDKWVVEQYPVLDNKPALMRAYKQTTLNDGNGNAWVQRNEFPCLIRNLLYFNKLFFIFSEIDQEGDRRINYNEFKEGIHHLGLNIPEDEIRAEFELMDLRDGGLILFDEFCAYAANKAIPVDGVVLTDYTLASKEMGRSRGKAKGKDEKKKEQQRCASVLMKKFEPVEKKFKEYLSDKRMLRKVWRRIDYNGNNIVSLAEIDKWVIEHYPLINHKPALLRAYKKTTHKDGEGDGFVKPADFAGLLRDLIFFVKAFAVFMEIDQTTERRVTVEEFIDAQDLLGMHLSPADAKNEFAMMDSNGSGMILFEDFCKWLAAKCLPIDEHVTTI